jgi:hypothetical protein
MVCNIPSLKVGSHYCEKRPKKTLIPILNAETMHNMTYKLLQPSITIKNMNAINQKHVQQKLNIHDIIPSHETQKQKHHLPTPGNSK